MKLINMSFKGLLAATFLQASALTAVAQEATVGVQLYTLDRAVENFDPSLRLEEKLKIVRDAGYSNVEAAGRQTLDANGWNALLTQYNMRVSSSHEQLDDLRNDLQGVIDFNRAIGNNVIIMPFLPTAPTTAAGWEALGKELGGYADVLHANGMTFLYHNHADEIKLYGDKYAIEIVLDAAGPNLKSQLDLAWVNRAGQDPVEVLKRLYGRVSAVHAKDTIGGLENTGFAEMINVPQWGFADVGSGVLNWQEIIPAIYASGIGLYVVEHDFPLDALTTIRNGLQYLNANLHLRPDFQAFAVTPNQAAVANTINGMAPLSEVYSAVFLANDGTAALEQLNGSVHSSAQSALVQDMHLFHNTVGNRIASAFAERAQGSAPEMSIGELTFWTQAMAARGEQDNANTGTLDRSVRGFLMGADALLFDSWTVGLAAGYSRSSFDNWNSDGNSDNYHVGLYGGTTFGAFSIKTGLGYTRHEIETQRNVNIAAGGASLVETLSADYSADAFQAFGELAYLIETNGFSFEPYAGLTHVTLKSDGFRETGGAAALSADGDTINTTFTTIGVKTATDLELGSMQAVARTGLGWRHALGDVDPASQLSFATGDAFTVSSPIAKDVALVEAGLDFNIAPSAVVGVSYTGQFGSGERSNAVNASLKVKF